MLEWKTLNDNFLARKQGIVCLCGDVRLQKRFLCFTMNSLMDASNRDQRYFASTTKRRNHPGRVVQENENSPRRNARRSKQRQQLPLQNSQRSNRSVRSRKPLADANTKKTSHTQNILCATRSGNGRAALPAKNQRSESAK